MTTSTETNIKTRDLKTIDLLSQKAKQLAAMLRLTISESGECLRNQTDGVQHDYFWACSDLADEVSELAETL